MTTIKLNRYYPHMTESITLEVSDEIAVVLSAGGRQCDSYKRRKREHNECSLVRVFITTLPQTHMKSRLFGNRQTHFTNWKYPIKALV